MDKLDQLIDEIRRMNANLEVLIGRQGISKWVKMPEAAKIFNISYAKFRMLCIEGMIPTTMTNENPNMRHYLVNIEEARKAMLLGGYLTCEREKLMRKNKQGRKPKTQLI